MMLRPQARVFAGAIGLIALVSLGLQAVATAADHPEFTPLMVLWRLLRFFTILTNALVAATFLRMAATGRAAGAGWLGGVTLWIGIVGVVYHVLLAKPQAGVGFWADLGLHSVVPVVVVLWWIAAAPKDGLGLRVVLAWLAWPLLYVVYALLRGSVEGIYPYFFVNPVEVGWPGVLRWSATLCGFFFVAGLGLAGIARLLPARDRR